MTRGLRWLPVWIVALAVVFGTGLWVGSPRRADSPVLLREVQELSELVTVKYVMSHVMTKEKVTWLGTDQILLVAQGVVKAGIDLRRMKEEDLRVVGKSVSIRLPRAEVTDNYLVEKYTYVYDRRTGLLVKPERTLEGEARREALSQMLIAAHQSGIHKEAETRARELVARLFRQLGFEKVEFDTEKS
jgi:hypothetical protein